MKDIRRARERTSLLPTALAGAAVGIALAAAVGSTMGMPLRCAEDLPLSRWRRHDLGMLQGCWHRQTDMETREVGSGQRRTVDSWKLCFDSDGAGFQTVVWTDGGSCHSAVAASFRADDTLVLDTQECQRVGYRLLALSIACRWQNPTQADCPAYYAGGKPIKEWPGGFHQGIFRR